MGDEVIQNEKEFVKCALIGECWYKDCCVSEHPDSLRYGKYEVENEDEKMNEFVYLETM